MKKVTTILILVVAATSQAQVAIGKEDVSNTSVSLEFAETEPRGLILPYVEDKSGITEEGTIIYDTEDNTVKYLKDGGTWVSLSGDGTPSTEGSVDLSIQGTDKVEQLTAKTGIGVETSTDGILVLEDDDKAMILPRIASPQDKITQPAAGMMAYDTDSGMLAIFNGTVWSFWKPQ